MAASKLAFLSGKVGRGLAGPLQNVTLREGGRFSKIDLVWTNKALWTSAYCPNTTRTQPHNPLLSQTSFFATNNYFRQEERMAKPEPGVSDKAKEEQPLSRKEKLKQAVKDYGSTVLVFHITMSLCSLGLVYLLVSSGLDMVGLLAKIGVGEQILESKITQGASTFVIAYAVHKVFAPVRIAITLSATPLIVKKLRAIGILKKPIPK